jgi:hypothetical protein
MLKPAESFENKEVVKFRQPFMKIFIVRIGKGRWVNKKPGPYCVPAMIRQA